MSRPAASTPDLQVLGHAVLVQGEALAWLTVLAVRGQAAAARDGAPAPPHVRRWLDTIADLARSGQNRMSFPGHADVRAGGNRAESSQVDEVDSHEAAELLGVTARHVRRLGPSLGARRARGRWIFDRSIVVAYRTALEEVAPS